MSRTNRTVFFATNATRSNIPRLLRFLVTPPLSPNVVLLKASSSSTPSTAVRRLAQRTVASHDFHGRKTLRRPYSSLGKTTNSLPRAFSCLAEQTPEIFQSARVYSRQALAGKRSYYRYQAIPCLAERPSFESLLHDHKPNPTTTRTTINKSDGRLSFVRPAGALDADADGDGTHAPTQHPQHSLIFSSALFSSPPDPGRPRSIEKKPHRDLSKLPRRVLHQVVQLLPRPHHSLLEATLLARRRRRSLGLVHAHALHGVPPEQKTGSGFDSIFKGISVQQQQHRRRSKCGRSGKAGWLKKGGEEARGLESPWKQGAGFVRQVGNRTCCKTL